MTVYESYGNRLRVRGCGILVRDHALLMVHHLGFWAPPGGGVNFGESVQAAVEREIMEETGIRGRVKDLLFTTEFIKSPLHAIELFFLVEDGGGDPIHGTDPEVSSGDQVIKEVAFLSWDQIAALPPDALHGIFRFVDKPVDITALRGFFRV